MFLQRFSQICTLFASLLQTTCQYVSILSICFNHVNPPLSLWSCNPEFQTTWPSCSRDRSQWAIPRLCKYFIESQSLSSQHSTVVYVTYHRLPAKQRSQNVTSRYKPMKQGHAGTPQKVQEYWSNHCPTLQLRCCCTSGLSNALEFQIQQLNNKAFSEDLQRYHMGISAKRFPQLGRCRNL